MYWISMYLLQKFQSTKRDEDDIEGLLGEDELTKELVAVVWAEEIAKCPTFIITDRVAQEMIKEAQIEQDEPEPYEDEDWPWYLDYDQSKYGTYVRCDIVPEEMVYPVIPDPVKEYGLDPIKQPLLCKLARGEKIIDLPHIKKPEQIYSRITGEVNSSYTPPVDYHMGPPIYPPAVNTGEIPVSSPLLSEISSKGKGKNPDYYNAWTLPPAHYSTGVMLVLPDDISKYEDVITRWESINTNVINRMQWPDKTSKVLFVENLLGETEKRTFQQWRLAYPKDYEDLVNKADDIQNVLS